MKIITIYYSSHFARAFQKLETQIRKRAILKEKIFRSNCFDQTLNTHKLKRELQPYWAFSINRSYRIIFEFTKDGSVGFIDIGTHYIYG